jgi:hypothetical protein
MKKIIPFLVVLLILPGIIEKVFSQSDFPDRDQKEQEIQYDRYERMIKKGDQQFVYPFDETLIVNTPATSANTLDGIAMNKGEVHCDPVWKQAVMGTCIGLNSMHSADIDNDGKIEIICSGGQGFSGGSFWYILEYNEATTNYDFQWSSDFYTYGYPNYERIKTIALFDIDADGNYEILVGREDGLIEIYDAVSMNLVREVQYTSNPVNDIIHADGDNDGTKEIIFTSGDGYTYFIETQTFTEKHQIQYTSDYIRAGEVNGDGNIDLVYSNGKVITFNGSSVNELWNFNTSGSYQGYIELSDIDSDGMEEIIFARYWYNIYVYDADIQALKYQIDSDLDIDALLVTDVNNDGIDEILYGDGQWGNIYCHNAVTTELLWDIYNPDHGTTNINVADVDNDGQLEVLWGAGCSSTGSDHLFVHEIPSGNFEWQSKHLDPPFYAVEIADVDGDGVMEIITISHESNSGYDSGIMTIFSADDFSMEWQGDPNYFPMVWTGIYNVKVGDVDNDGETEIIVAAGRTYTGQLWIINGSTREIEATNIFYSQDFDEFRTLAVGDVNGNGNPECVVGEDNKIHIIKPSDFSVEWSSGILSPGYIKAIHIANVDTDPNNEIIVCNGSIIIIDGLTHSQTQTAASNFTDIAIYDINNDGFNDVVGCTSNGFVNVIDGQTQQFSILFETNGLQLDMIEVADITGNGEHEYIYSAQGIIYFRTQSGDVMQTQNLGTHAAKYDGFKLSDYDNDGKYEIFVGTNYQVVLLDETCYECLGFEIELTGTDVSCNPANNGSVEVFADGGLEPYAYLWNTGDTTAQVSNLGPGTFTVTVTDSRDCEVNSEITIYQSQLITSLETKKVGCTGHDDGEAFVQIFQGTPPFLFNWSTGENTNAVSGLPAGEYWVEVIDSVGCISNHQFTILQDTVMYSLFHSDIDCYGYQNGEAWVNIWDGVPPFEITWSNGMVGNNVHSLPPGAYSVTVKDALFCEHTAEFTIVEPAEFSATTTVTPDDPETSQGEGTATLEVIGGMPPYYFQWYDPYYQTNYQAVNLVSGEYFVEITDVNGCKIEKYVFVPLVNSVGETLLSANFEFFPNPTDDQITIKFNESLVNEYVDLFLINSMGHKVISMENILLFNEKMLLDVSSLPIGLYFILITHETESISGKVQIF